MSIHQSCGFLGCAFSPQKTSDPDSRSGTHPTVSRGFCYPGFPNFGPTAHAEAGPRNLFIGTCSGAHPLRPFRIALGEANMHRSTKHESATGVCARVALHAIRPHEVPSSWRHVPSGSFPSKTRGPSKVDGSCTIFEAKTRGDKEWQSGRIHEEPAQPAVFPGGFRTSGCL